jgi:Ca2+-binding RTX toxin-like protein
MTSTFKWTRQAEQLGIASFDNIFDLFNMIVGGDDFDITRTTSKTIKFDGTLGFGGYSLDLTLTAKGRGFSFDDGDLVSGSFRSMKLDLNLDNDGSARLFTVKKLDISSGDLVAAIDTEDLGGDSLTVENLFYADGVRYVGTNASDEVGRNISFVDGQPFGFEGVDRIITRGGDDNVDAGDGDDLISGGNGNDTLRGGLGEDTIKGGKGDDEIFGDANHFDGAYFVGQNDRILGGNGRDTIDSGAGDDVVDGGRGPDFLVDAEGTNTFIFRGNSGHDLMWDVNNNGAILDIRTDDPITTTFINLEDELTDGPWAGEYFDRGYLIEWGNNSLLVQTYADIDEFTFL